MTEFVNKTWIEAKKEKYDTSVYVFDALQRASLIFIRRLCAIFLRSLLRRSASHLLIGRLWFIRSYLSS